MPYLTSLLKHNNNIMLLNFIFKLEIHIFIFLIAFSTGPMFFLYSLKPAEHTISAFMGAFLEEYLVYKSVLNVGYIMWTQCYIFSVKIIITALT